MNNKSIVFIETPISLIQRYGEMSTAAHLVPPLGLMSLAAVTRREGYNTDIIDGAALGLNLHEIVELLEKRKPHYIGLTAATVGFKNTAEMAKKIKKKLPETIIIIGGVHVTALPIISLKENLQFDIAAIGEGEATIVELLDVLQRNGDLSKINGIAYRNGNKVILNPPRAIIKDLDSLPFPAWDLVPNLKTHYHPAPHLFRRLPSTTISTSRGCFGSCTFCDRSVFGQRCRAFSAKYLIDMVKFLINTYGLKDIWIGDDLFVMFRSRLREFCNLLIEEKLDLTWACCARVGMLKEDTLTLMKKAGCYEIVFGIESGDQNMLDRLKKGTNLKQIQHDLTLTKKVGIRTNGTFMIGLPEETKESMQASIDFAKKIDLDMLQISFFTPFPGSELSYNIEKYGSLIKDFSKMNVFGNIVFIPDGLSKNDLFKYYKKFYREFYLRPKTVFSFLKDLESMKDLIAYTGGAWAVMKLAFSRKISKY